MRQRYKYTKEDKAWSLAVRERDNGCAICRKIEYACAHHLIPREIKAFKHVVDNGITLCPNHHRFSRDISAHQNPLAFFMWMEIHRPGQLACARLAIDLSRFIT